jgi:hypothetical protein
LTEQVWFTFSFHDVFDLLIVISSQAIFNPEGLYWGKSGSSDWRDSWGFNHVIDTWMIGKEEVEIIFKLPGSASLRLKLNDNRV